MRSYTIDYNSCKTTSAAALSSTPSLPTHPLLLLLHANRRCALPLPPSRDRFRLYPCLVPPVGMGRRGHHNSKAVAPDRVEVSGGKKLEPRETEMAIHVSGVRNFCHIFNIKEGEKKT